MAPKRESDDMNAEAPDINEKSARRGWNDSIISDDHQNMLNNRQSIQEFTEKLWGDRNCNMKSIQEFTEKLFGDRICNMKSIQEFTEKLFGDRICNMKAEPKQKTVTRVPWGKNADKHPPLRRKSERIKYMTKTEDVRHKFVSVYDSKIRFILVF